MAMYVQSEIRKKEINKLFPSLSDEQKMLIINIARDVRRYARSNKALVNYACTIFENTRFDLVEHETQEGEKYEKLEIIGVD